MNKGEKINGESKDYRNKWGPNYIRCDDIDDKQLDSFIVIVSWDDI